MINYKKITKKIEKKYKKTADNIYSYKFYQDLFSGYSYSLGEKKLSKNKFFYITSHDKNIKNLFRHAGYDFSYELEKNIDKALYSLALYGTSYLYVKPSYYKTQDNSGQEKRQLSSLNINEVKGILKNKHFFTIDYSKKVTELNLNDGILIILDLKELGYKRKYFVQLVKKLTKYDTTSASIELTNNEPSYNFKVHVNKNREHILKIVKETGWMFETDGLSSSYILYKEIKMRLFKIKLLNYILYKINKSLTENYIHDDSFKIQASLKEIDYNDIWKKYQSSELTTSDLNKLLW